VSGNLQQGSNANANLSQNGLGNSSRFPSLALAPIKVFQMVAKNYTSDLLAERS